MAVERFAKKVLHGLMLLGVVFTTAGIGIPTSTSRNLEFASSAQVQAVDQWQDFGLVAPSTGWVLLDQRLYWTADDGGHWNEITPLLSTTTTLLAITFLDSHTGWVLWDEPLSDGTLAVQLSSTTDGGSQWDTVLVQSLPADDLDVNIENASMDWLDGSTGWISLRRQTGSTFSAGALFHTADGGRTWDRSVLPVGGQVRFVESQTGWLVGGPANDQLFKSTDSGQTWLEQSLPGGLPAGQVSTVYLPRFDSPDHGLLAAIITTAELPQLNLYSTSDGGQTWTPLASWPLNAQASLLPAALFSSRDFAATIAGENRILRLVAGQPETLTNQDGMSAGIVDLRMLSLDFGWAKWNNSTCAKVDSPSSPGTTEIQCSTSTQLIETGDGGLTWKPILLPETRSASLFQSGSIASSLVPQVSTAAGDNTQVYIGKGFDSCHLAPLSLLDVWDDYSPYGSMNLYIGGAALYDGCITPALTASYVAQAYQIGFNLFPTWVGPQAPCTSYYERFNWNVDLAYLDGIDQANQAIDRLAVLGLTTAQKSGSMVYYDLETFVGDQACRDAVKSFMNGWDYQLMIRGNKSGIYGSTGCTNGINNFLSIDNKPNAIWAALWDDRATVWGLGCISDGVWTSHQRIHQYSGAHNEVYQGYSLNIDSNAMDGLVAIPNQTVTPPAPSATFLASPTSGTGPLAVDFYITNTANITTCAWVFGDGQTGSTCDLGHTRHTYANSGSYSVTLTVSGPGGADALTRSNYIIVSEPAYPDLVPFPRPLSSDPITISSVTGTYVNDILYVNQPVFIDWGFKNIGTANISVPFKTYLYIDDQRIVDTTFQGLSAGAASGHDDTPATWNTVGWHTLRLVVDPENSVAESNENNNTWTKQFYWENEPAPGPVIISPLENEVVNTSRPQFKWSPPVGTTALSYNFYINSLAPGGMFYSETVSVSYCSNSICTFSLASSLSSYGDYQYKVGAMDKYGVWTYSPWTTFSYTNQPPAAPTGLTPSGTIQDASPAFSWSMASYANQYELYVYPQGSTNPIFTKTSIQAIPNCTTIKCIWSPLTLLDRGNYSFRVRAMNASGFTDSAPGYFYVDADLSRLYLPWVRR